MGIKLLIFVISISLTGLLGYSDGIRQWWRAFLDHKGPALVLSGATLATFIGGTAYDIDSLIPDPTRALRGLILTILFFVSLSGILRSPNCWRNAGTGAHWMLAYAFLAILSAIYSVGPLISAYKGGEVLVLVMTGLYVAGNLNHEDDLRWLLGILSLILLFIAITVPVGFLLAPGEAFRVNSEEIGASKESAWAIRGVLGGINPTSVGGVGALLLVSALVPALDKYSKRSTTGLWIAVSIGVLVMLMAHSRTAIFGASVAVLVLLIFNRKMMIAISIAVLVPLVMLFTGFGDQILSYIYRGQSQELFLSMSGRTYYWGLIFDKYLESPIIGHGFYAGIRVLFQTSASDNSYLATLLGLGIIGLTVMLIPIIYLITTLLRTRPRHDTPWHGDIVWIQITGLATIVLVRSPVGTSFEILHHLLVFYMVLQISAATYHRIWKQRTNPAYQSVNTGDNHTDPVQMPTKRSFIPAKRKITTK